MPTIRRNDRGLAIDAPAKINLFLEILGKRDDGFHELETLMVSVSLADTLTVEPADDLRLTIDGNPDLPTDDTNLILKAARLLAEHTGCSRGAHFHLTKRIPTGGGLGGGSSNAVAALRLASTLWELDVSDGELMKLGGRLGSDVPFFVADGPAICRGRGEIVEPCRLPWGELSLVLLFPAVHVSTPRVFQSGIIDLTSPRRTLSFLTGPPETNEARAAAGRLFNRLESATFELYPELNEIATMAGSLDAPGWRMSGSGSTFYVLAESPTHAEELARQISTDLCVCQVVSTLIHPPS